MISIPISIISQSVDSCSGFKDYVSIGFYFLNLIFRNAEFEPFIASKEVRKSLNRILSKNEGKKNKNK